jgi:hypothetical protein
LEKQLVLKKVFSIEEFQVFKDEIEYEFSKDSYFSELKDQEMLLSRSQVLTSIQPFIGMYFSNMYVRKEILKQDDKEIEKIDAEIAEEQENYQYLPPEQKMMLQQAEMQQDQMDQQMAADQAMAATPQGQAQQVVSQAKTNPNPSLQDLSKLKRSQRLLGSA